MSFHQEKHVFQLARRWLPPLCLLYLTKEICWFRFLGMTSSLLYFLQSPMWTVPYFRVSSHFTTTDLVFLSILIICPRWIQCFPWFSALTRSPTQTHKASQLVDSFFLLPKKGIWFEMMQCCTSNYLLPVAIPHLLLYH